MLHPAFNTLFSRKAPLVKLLDVKSDVTDLTTYTFTACNVGDIGSSPIIAGDDYAINPHMRSPGRKMIAIAVHGEAATITFDVTSVSIGGVAGTQRVDRGGGTNAINTAIFTWYTDILHDITNTDVVVVWSKAITCCAIGILSIENLGIGQFIQASSVTATGSLSTVLAGAITLGETNILLIGASTCATGGGTEFYSTGAQTSSSGTGQVDHMILYADSNAEIDYAAYWTYLPMYPGGNSMFRCVSSWSGAGAGDEVVAAFV